MYCPLNGVHYATLLFNFSCVIVIAIVWVKDWIWWWKYHSGTYQEWTSLTVVSLLMWPLKTVPFSFRGLMNHTVVFYSFQIISISLSRVLIWQKHTHTHIHTYTLSLFCIP
jgi:hypothetical protein